MEMTCDLCTALSHNTHTYRRHERLLQTGVTRRLARPGKGKAAWLTFHTCETCGTDWRHLDDPANPDNPHAGWTIERSAAPCE
jgi:hypothetical protein